MLRVLVGARCPVWQLMHPEGKVQVLGRDRRLVPARELRAGQLVEGLGRILKIEEEVMDGTT